MPAPFVNIHGRSPTRGIRPYLLIPKVLGVGIYIGALVAALTLWVARGTVAFTPPAGVPLVVAVPATTAAVNLLFTYVCLPALGVATFFGVLLFAQHPRVFARQRWWQVKMVLLILGMPGGEALVFAAFKRLHRADAAAGSLQLEGGLALLLFVAILLVILGRQKPRLGQNPARATAQADSQSPIRNPQSLPPHNPDELFKL